MKESNTLAANVTIKQLRNLADHQRAIHEGVKIPCRQREEQFSSQGDVSIHQREVHEGGKYPCGIYDYQATQKGNLA